MKEKQDMGSWKGILEPEEGRNSVFVLEEELGLILTPASTWWFGAKSLNLHSFLSEMESMTPTL